MDEILQYVDKLTKILVNSDVYQNYLLAKKNLNNSDLKLMTEFKKLHKEFISSGSNNFDKEKLISHLYSNLMLKAETRLFLESELNLTNCMKEIHMRISDGINIDVFA